MHMGGALAAAFVLCALAAAASASSSPSPSAPLSTWWSSGTIHGRDALARFLLYPSDRTADASPSSPDARLRAWLTAVHASLRTDYHGLADQALRDNSSDPYFAFIPTVVGAAVPGAAAPLRFTGRCYAFSINVASFAVSGADLVVSATATTSSPCEELLMIAVMDAFHLVVTNSSGTHTVQWKAPIAADLNTWIQRNGFRMLLWPCAPTECLEQIYATIELFAPELFQGPPVPDESAQRNLAFLRDRAAYDMAPRPVDRIDLDESQINSGDFFGILRLDGLDPTLAWAMGAHTGHTTIALWIDGELFICESTINSVYWPTNGIQKTPYRQWLDQAYNASYNVVHLPLAPAYRALFNETAAAHWFLTVAEGLPYG